MSTFKRRTIEEFKKMTEEEFISYMDVFDRYTELKRRELYEGDMPHFSSEEELMANYHAIPFEDADKIINKILM